MADITDKGHVVDDVPPEDYSPGGQDPSQIDLEIRDPEAINDHLGVST